MTEIKDEKIRVLHVIHTLNLGGAESNLYNLACFHDKYRIEAHVAYAAGGPFEEKLRRLGLQLYKYATVTKKVKSLASVIIVLKLASYMRNQKIQVVHTHNYNAHVWGSIAARLVGAKVVEHVHDPRYEPPGYLASRGLPETRQFSQAKFFARFSDRIFVLTRQNHDFLVSSGIAPKEKVNILLNGIPLAENVVQPLISRETIAPQGSEIIFTAMRLSPEKNADAVLEIARLVKDPRAFFVIAGDGPQKTELEKKCREQKLDAKVRFLGYRSDVRTLLGHSDIFILPTLRELHSLTMTEAMGLGLPVLVSKGAGCNDDFISHGKCGFLLDPRRPEQWAEMIDKLLQDNELRRNVGEAAKKLVYEKCDIKKTIVEIEKLYMEILSGRS